MALRIPVSALILLLAVANGGCRRDDAHGTTARSAAPVAGGDPWFESVGEAAGVTFRQTAHLPSPYFMPALIGGGIALCDFDNDDRLDLYALNAAGPSGEDSNRYFRQSEDGRFADATAGSGLDLRGHFQGVAVGDVNNDGCADIVLTEYAAARLLLGDGAGHFREVAERAGLVNGFWGTSAAFTDYDRDGWLDLVIANYLEYDPQKDCLASAGQNDFCGPSSFGGTAPRLFRNLTGDPDSHGEVRFQDVTVESGLGGHASAGLGVWCGDFDGDRWPDIFVANDGRPNSLFVNARDGTFREEATFRGLAHNRMGQAEANMGIAVGDGDGDGLFNVFVTHLTDESHRLWKQGPRGLFADATVEARLADVRSTGFGTLFADFDHDGDVDLAIANGRVVRAEGVPPAAVKRKFWSPYHDRNAILENGGDGRFDDVSADNPAFCGPPGVYRGLACGDLDNDGDVDLAVSQLGGPLLLLRNVAPKRGHWLTVRAVDPALRRDAYGAEVAVEAEGRRWVRWLNPGYSYACSNDPRLHFGLGAADRLDAILVIWPDGAEERFPGGGVDRHVVLRRGESLSVSFQSP